MTLRRHAPLALAALALACQPAIDERPNSTTVDYALFNPAASQIPTPNDVALSSVAAFLPGGAFAAAPCNVAPTPTAMALCAYARAGGFPAQSPAQISFVRGTLGSDGTVAYGVAPDTDALDTGTLAFAGASLAPSLGVVDLTTVAPVVNATPSFNDVTGVLTLSPNGGAWTAGHKYAVMVLGGARGPQTLTGGAYLAMPAFYILREAVIADKNLSLEENQALFPGDAAAKAASGAALEPLRANYRLLYEIAGPLLDAPIPTGLNLPFADAASLQTFQIAPGGTVTIGDDDGTDPGDATVTGGATAMFDAFTLDSSLSSATVQAITFTLNEGAAAVANLTVSATSDCTVVLGTSAAVAADGAVVIPMTNWLDVKSTATTSLFVCAVTKTPGGATNVTGGVTGVTTFAGTGFTVAGTGADSSAQLTVNP